ncbi:Signal transduction histidine kinase [Stigmatella aurantiaca]|uniref:histidine kinase n=1 Tax=Stigmatella aurantiaca TaxID=41 RepID=A0A1H8B0L3_STIAU|nr:ATP-binding protein [Stigmatella aurantiaca]SEM75674.1 Signal transduction histidine kinase [Stigmatella aurantiaca]
MSSGSTAEDVFAEGGEMGALMRSFDWAKTELGPVESWPLSLRTMVGVVLSNRFPMAIRWGERLLQFYNDAYRPILGDKHPASLGAPASQAWPEIWNVLGPLHEKVLRHGTSEWAEHFFLPMHRKGFSEETYFTFSYSPIPEGSGRYGGVLVTAQETTSQVLSERRLHTLQQVSASSFQAKRVDDAAQRAVRALGENPNDVPFVLLYLCEQDGKQLSLAASTGLPAGHPPPPGWLGLELFREGGPLAEGLSSREPLALAALSQHLGLALQPEAPRAATRAVVLPLEGGAEGGSPGFLIAGLSIRLEYDAQYRGFMGLVAGHIATAIANARAYEEEKRRAETLAELDRSKTVFFSNVSHEFRTPLTLMLGPVEDVLASDRLEREEREALERVHRNGLRLFKLVNTLLDFSRLEAGRMQASYQPTDLAALTVGLASAFDSAVAKAGLRLVVECPPLPAPVWVDPEMWEKVVLNLVSNALKFTFEGEIGVALRWREDHVELSVRDTGTGIPPEELPRIFERFHRVHGAKGRSHEGSGIGLSLVQELVRLHGGTVRAESTLGQGSTFTVSLPAGSAHLPRERLAASRAAAPASARVAPFLNEASGWLSSPRPAPETAPAPPPTVPLARSQAPQGHILLADDNADMRDYVRRLLEARFTVEAVAEGRAALAAAEARVPDLVLSDVMMPGLDGFGLLREFRANPRTAAVPFILLSARAGEEATVGGLQAGADDYLVKPFSARELLARVEGALRLARERAARERLARERADFEQHLIGIVSHDLRNPLAAITMSAATLLRRTDLEERQRRPIGRIFASAERANRMIRDLLDFTQARLGGGLPLQPQALDFHALSQQVVDELQVAHPERAIELERGGAGQAFWDGDRTAQVLTNLISNALHYSPPGTPVRVRADEEGTEGVLEVHNEGAPIPAELVPRLFQPMQRGDKERNTVGRSVGLGLYIVDHIVRAHGGRVEVKSVEGEGTRFTVRMPLTVAAGGAGGAP